MTEHAISIALPHSARADDAVHVSVFITPQLSGAVDATLGDFAGFLHWATAVKNGLTVTLSDQSGEIECTPLLTALRPDAWDALFPATTPVRANVVPDWSDRHWRSFDAAAADQLGKALVTATASLSPVQPMAPSQHPLTRVITQLVANEMPSTRGDRGEKIDIDDERLNKTLDRLTSELPPRDIRPQSGSSSNAGFNVSAALATFHAVRNYYNRPEAQVAYQETPTSASAPMPTPEPEFHERVAHLGDHPEVLRALGLVIDLTVADVARLRASTWLRATIEVAGLSAAGPGPLRGGLTNAAPRVACRATADGALVTTSEAAAGAAEWIDGALALGRTERFTVLETETDGTALKMEMFLRELPHLWNSERNTEPVDAATPALRASGLTVARRGQARALQDRLGAQKVLAAKLGVPRRPGGGRPRHAQNNGEVDVILIPATPPTLHSEDVARGLRVEVWDTGGTAWRSLHARHTTAFIEGLAAPLDLGDGFGFIQSAPAEQTPNVVDAPINVHESVFGWEGWSLSVGKPGRRVREVPVPQPDGTAKIEEVVEDTPATLPTDAPNRIRFEHRITPDTLPPLRFGRRYAFRAWLVDLAGNVRPEVIQAPAPHPGGLLDVLRDTPRLRDLLLDTVPPRVASALDLFVAKAAVKASEIEAKSAAAAATPRARKAAGAAGTLSGGRAATSVLSPLAARIATRAGAVEAAFREHLESVAAGTTIAVPAPVDAVPADTLIAPLLERQLRDIGGIGAVGAGAGAAAAAASAYTRAADTVTAPHAFLRWDPVAPPALVPRALYSDGESVRVLVIRSAVTQNPATLEVDVADSADVAQRHVAPPKTSQTQAELHGAFDPIIGATPTPASLRAALAVALRENGSFFDLDVADPDTPGSRDPVSGVALVTEPTAAGPLRTLPLPAGEAPAVGQYVVHDVDDLVLPYLPDPLARGVSIVFPDARLLPALPTPFGIEGFTADYPVGARGWPFVESYRLTLAAGHAARVDVAGRVLAFSMPAGTVQRARIGSSLQQRALRMLGVWRSFPDAITTRDGISEAALDGYLWSLTPSLPLRLVHAVPRPVEAPRPVTFRAARQQAATDTWFVGSVHLHGPSTEQLTAEASWIDVVDNPGDTRWRERPSNGLAFTTITNEIERLAVFEPRSEEWMPREQADPDDPTVWFHRVAHDFGDTKHRRVTYRLRASTRFREFFPPAQLTGDPAVAFDDGASTVSAEIEVSVPSSARPAPPIVHSVIPLFRWSNDDPSGTEPVSADDNTAQAGQPIAERHERLAGVRIYLQRPWFSSGEGELLAVLTGNAVTSTGPVSAWAQDPIWADDRSVASVSLGNAQLEDPWRDMGVDDALHPGRPITSAANLALPLTADGTKTYRARAWGYRPQFNEARGLWYVDVAISPGAAAWPFLRLAVARYQPESLPGLELSAPVRCDFVQVPPERSVVASRTDERCVRVVVTGPIPRRSWTFGDTNAESRLPLTDERIVVARLQRKDPDVAGDLGWITVDVSELPVQATDAATRTVSWGDELRADHDVTLRRPGAAASTWRVVVEEWERFVGDPLLGPTIRGVPIDPEHQPLTSEQRMVFADEVYL